MDWIKKVLAKEGAEQSAPKPITSVCDILIGTEWIDKIMEGEEDGVQSTNTKP